MRLLVGFSPPARFPLRSAGLASSHPKSIHLQLIRGRSPPPPIGFQRPAPSSTPCQFVVSLSAVTSGSLELTSSVSCLHVRCHLLGDLVNVFSLCRSLSSRADQRSHAQLRPRPPGGGFSRLSLVSVFPCLRCGCRHHPGLTVLLRLCGKAARGEVGQSCYVSLLPPFLNPAFTLSVHHLSKRINKLVAYFLSHVFSRSI